MLMKFAAIKHVRLCKKQQAAVDTFEAMSQSRGGINML